MSPARITDAFPALNALDIGELARRELPTTTACHLKVKERRCRRLLAARRRMNFKNAARELGAAGLFSGVDQEHLVPFFEEKLKAGAPESRDAWVWLFDELGEEVGKHASHSKLGHELLKFASDLKHAPGDKADRALHQLNVGQVN